MGHPRPRRKGAGPALPNSGVPFYLCVTMTLCCRATKFDVVTHMGSGLFSGDCHVPTPLMVAGPQRSPFLASKLK